MDSLIYFLIVAALFVVMMRFGCGAHVMGHGHRHGRPAGSERGPDEARWNGPIQDKDPVCGMTVETGSAKSSLYQGRAYYFCSPDCRDKFESSPERYAGTRGEAPQVMEAKHGAHH